MNYYHIKLMGDVQQLERPSESFAQENNWMYFLKEKEDLFIVTGAANTKRENSKKGSVALGSGCLFRWLFFNN
ncbi:hypothetical protein ACTGVI_00550 [Streptococcus suis]